MKILIVGGGGREHAIAWKLAKSPKVEKMYCAPGNAGIAEVAECVNIGVMEFDKLVAFAKEHEIDLTVVAPDDPLAAGAVDAFEAAGLRAFGPRANAAILEGSKAFSKDLMKKYGIPTAAYETFNDPEKALAYLETAKMPIVLKADGLALGKGVLICKDLEEAKAGVKTLMMDKQFGSAGDEIVIEEFMTGREVSVLSFVDGKTIKILCPGSQAREGRRPGTEHRRYGNLLSKSVLYSTGGCILHGTHLPEDCRRHEGRGQRVQGHHLLRPDADCRWSEGTGVQRQIR